MAIQKRFIHFKKFSDFNSKKLSANEANTQYTVGVSGAIQNGEPDVLYQSYCWIKDTKQQWTHGQLYNGTDSLVTESTISEWGFTKNTGTVNSVKINGTTKSPSSGVVDLGTVITAHQDISGKQDKLVSGTNIKTINGESIVGSGDLTIEGGAKIYTWSPTITSIEDTKISGTFTEEEYYNILNADVLYINVDGESIFCIARGINSENGEGIRITGSQITTYADFAIDIFVIKEGGVFTGTISEPIPSKTSQLENDSNFISSDGLKTINGESIIGSGDITISGGVSEDYVNTAIANAITTTLNTAV